MGIDNVQETDQNQQGKRPTKEELVREQDRTLNEMALLIREVQRCNETRDFLIKKIQRLLSDPKIPMRFLTDILSTNSLAKMQAIVVKARTELDQLNPEAPLDDLNAVIE